MARIVVQAAQLRSPAGDPSHRDRMMAANVRWLLEEVYPEERIVL